MKFLWKVALAVIVAGLLTIGGVLAARSFERRKPLSVSGAIIRQSDDPSKEAPIAGVSVTAFDAGVAVSTAKSDFFGSFTLHLPRGFRIGDEITLSFRDPDFQEVDMNQRIGESLPVVRMVALHGEVEAELNPSSVTISNVIIRYSTEADTATSIGTEQKTFDIMNTGNVPCEKQRPCSPDGKWKAAVASASMDAGEGNVFRNARASCIAGPCPFTRIDFDNFSRGGRRIGITVRDWSDTATYLLQAEVMHSQINNIVRDSYALIFGRGMTFTVPGAAEGTSVEAELNGMEIIFPLGPVPNLSWADCNVQTDKNQTKDFRCQLKQGYRFQ